MLWILLTETVAWACSPSPLLQAFPGGWGPTEVRVDGVLIVQRGIGQEVAIYAADADVPGTWTDHVQDDGLVLSSFRPESGWATGTDYAMGAPDGGYYGTSTIEVVADDAEPGPELELTSLQFEEVVEPGGSTSSCGQSTGPYRLARLRLTTDAAAVRGVAVLRPVDASGLWTNDGADWLAVADLGDGGAERSVLLRGDALYADCLQLQYLGDDGVLTDVGEPVCAPLPQGEAPLVGGSTDCGHAPGVGSGWFGGALVVLVLRQRRGNSIATAAKSSL